MGLIPSWLICLKNYNLLENRVGIYGAWTHNRAMQNDVRCLSEPVPRGHSSLSPMRPQCLGGIVLCEHMLSDSLVTVWPSGQVDCSHRVRYVFMEILPPNRTRVRVLSVRSSLNSISEITLTPRLSTRLRTPSVSLSIRFLWN